MKRSMKCTMGALLISTTIIGSINSIAVENSTYESQLGLSGKIYNVEMLQNTDNIYNNINELIITNQNVYIESSGSSVFVDAIVKFNDNTYSNVSHDATWKSQDTEVVFADQGRLLAREAGQTKVTVQYGSFLKEINVTVSKNIDIEDEIISTEQKVAARLSTMRSTVIQNAQNMLKTQWTPTKNLVGWKGQEVFRAGVGYIGIPYTQSPYQKDKTGFLNSMKKSDFYTTYNNGASMPRYGNDCSGFVSFAWGLARQSDTGTTVRKNTTDFINGIRNGTYKKVGSYNANSPTTTDLKTAYKNLQAGDAVVKSGHTFLIAQNNTSGQYVYAYEQTPSIAVYTKWTYSQMATDRYMPFTLTYMDSGSN